MFSLQGYDAFLGFLLISAAVPALALVTNKLISPSLLHLPLDVHTSTVGRSLGLLKRKQNDWKAVDEITKKLKSLCPDDPVKYDFSLFGLGVNEGFK